MTVTPAAAPRHVAIDWCRGLIMILMALDHVRYFFTNVPFAPENIEKTWLALFLTRWVTHLCAPGFFFLGGVSAALSTRRRGEPAPMHLVRRGLLLIALELTIIGFAWQFSPGYSFAGVIWCLGWSMIVLAGCVRLHPVVLGSIASVIIAGHDALMAIPPARFGVLEPVWRLLHVPGAVSMGSVEWFVLFPLIPWCAVMMLGYAMGPLWAERSEFRNRVLMWSGTAATLLFLLLRMTNSYGNSPEGWGGGRAPFIVYPSAVKTFISLLNLAKYPPSLQYLLMTLGPLLIALALLDRFRVSSQPIVVFGRVPFFFYLLHLYAIHLAALLLARINGQPSAWLGFPGGDSAPPGYGYGLGVVYAVWLAILVALYWPCRAYDAFKRTHHVAWTRYV
ncbi:MAG TPA: heparan-alpha-glucosaminide N-acetyltransferase domain-containing protein [Thermoanaerobaculia bacterium]|nr:heparan-alpha-glucosaminide N-acetyltransferase domain-containing protein [Thermoanaerobaculia bacterium]